MNATYKNCAELFEATRSLPYEKKSMHLIEHIHPLIATATSEEVAEAFEILFDVGHYPLKIALDWQNQTPTVATPAILQVSEGKGSLIHEMLNRMHTFTDGRHGALSPTIGQRIASLFQYWAAPYPEVWHVKNENMQRPIDVLCQQISNEPEQKISYGLVLALIEAGVAKEDDTIFLMNGRLRTRSLGSFLDKQLCQMRNPNLEELLDALPIAQTWINRGQHRAIAANYIIEAQPDGDWRTNERIASGKKIEQWVMMLDRIGYDWDTPFAESGRTFLHHMVRGLVVNYFNASMVTREKLTKEARELLTFALPKMKSETLLHQDNEGKTVLHELFYAQNGKRTLMLIGDIEFMAELFEHLVKKGGSQALSIPDKAGNTPMMFLDRFYQTMVPLEEAIEAKQRMTKLAIQHQPTVWSDEEPLKSFSWQDPFIRLLAEDQKLFHQSKTIKSSFPSPSSPLSSPRSARRT